LRLLAALFLLAVPAATAEAPVTLVSHARSGNRIEFRLDVGGAELEWITSGCFRFGRWWNARPAPASAGDAEIVPFEIKETSEALTVSTESLIVSLSKSGLRVRVTSEEGVPLMADVAGIQREDGRIWWEREAPPGTRYFGLGPRPHPNLNARGQSIQAAKPFLLASRGYAEEHIAPGSYTFDLASRRPDRYGIEIQGADRCEYYFYLGPTPKDIFEHRLAALGPVRKLLPADFSTTLVNPGGAKPTEGNWKSLYESVLQFAHGSLSGWILPSFDITPYPRKEPLLFQRALQLGTVIPELRGTPPPPLRRALIPYFLAYSEEALERGYPLIRTLAFQFPHDLEGARHNDQFMLGDELLVAPVYTPDGRRTVYLPQGVWTHLGSNQSHRGKQIIRIRAAADELPLFARNGSIVPLVSQAEDGLIELHYFPRLAGEFFIFESDLEDYSQVHAAPAGDYMRLEIESKKTRAYEWVVHHLDRPRAVSRGVWRYDEAWRNLHVRCQVQAGEDHVINISF
jgi:Glycosyl hydrolases family 31